MTVSTSFIHWAHYLHGATRERVQGVYQEMVAAFRQVIAAGSGGAGSGGVDAGAGSAGAGA